MKIDKNSAVAFDFSICDEDGNVLESSAGKPPYEYLHGCGQVVPGLEQALEGRIAGDTFTVTISPEQGYGVREEKNRSVLPRCDFSDEELVPGNRVNILTESGFGMAIVLEFDDEKVVLDTNHALAGKTLTYDITLLGVRAATFSERTCGHIHEPIVSKSIVKNDKLK
ncbi:MAG: peptidylprolyl isomerase [Gammaproteobacteria bacterium]|nr:peptidylprolyl isomerase [Gammaproteobacteria bacterium]